ncbi:hypothetical protein HDK77DRAFT_133503 [Phyllosticta capitalensis]
MLDAAVLSLLLCKLHHVELLRLLCVDPRIALPGVVRWMLLRMRTAAAGEIIPCSTLHHWPRRRAMWAVLIKRQEASWG